MSWVWVGGRLGRLEIVEGIFWLIGDLGSDERKDMFFGEGCVCFGEGGLV